MILDVGSGNAKRGDIGIDLYKGDGVDVVCHAEYLPFRHDIFSEVRHHCLLEHMGNPLRSLREQHRILLPGGVLEFVTDNAAYWRFYVGRAGAHMGGYASRGVNDKHYAVFTTEHIRNLVEGAGFRVTSIFYEDIPEGLMKSLERFVRRWKRFEHLTYPRAGVAAVKLQQVPVLG